MPEAGPNGIFTRKKPAVNAATGYKVSGLRVRLYQASRNLTDKNPLYVDMRQITENMRYFAGLSLMMRIRARCLGNGGIELQE